jgi:uncharacterized protein (DUF362 family)
MAALYNNHMKMQPEAMNMNRRSFLAGAAAGIWGMAAASGAPSEKTRVALAAEKGHPETVYEALRRIAPDIEKKLARKKRVIIKPNMVMVDRALTAAPAECMEALLEFLAPRVKDEILIAETPANGRAEEGYDNYGYRRLEKSYRVRFLNLDELPSVTGYVCDEKHHPRPVRLSKFLLDPEAFYISPARFKTHDRAIVTLGMKNLTVGAMLKDPGFRWDKNSKGKSDKHLVHGGRENQGIHYNLFQLARRIRPDLTVLDGFQGMEHNGPVLGTPVDHGVAVAGCDPIAADVTAARLMGFDPEKIGYLVFCGRAGFGETAADHIEIAGPPLADHVRAYRPHDTIEKQYGWMG